MTALPPHLRMRIVDREQVETIDPQAWDRLADRSRTANPFYERWNLIAALNHLDKDETIFIVTVYEGERLVCLFPALLKRKAGPFRYLSVWQFGDCLVSDVLCEPGVPLPAVLDHLMDMFKVTVLISSRHTDGGFDVLPDAFFCQLQSERKAVIEAISWDEYQARVPGKHRKENKRIVNRLIQKEHAKYLTSDVQITARWFPDYLRMERESWKSVSGGSIYSEECRRNYFAEALERGERQNKVEFQGIYIDGDPVAMSFRFKAQRNAYEIMTAYSSRYKHLYPGVVLELLNLDGIFKDRFALVDSCNYNNKVVDRVWPDRITISRTVVFGRSAVGRIERWGYRQFRRFRAGKRTVRLICD